MNDRKEHWEKIYADKDPLEVSWYQQAPTLSFRLIESMNLRADAPIIDVGGGTSTLVDALVGAGYRHLSVLDISRRALDHARRRLGDRAQLVQWYESDVTEFAAPTTYALWHDRAVFHFLTDAGDRRRYVETLKSSLGTGGQVVIAAFAVGGPTRCSGLDIVQYDREKIGRELGKGFELVKMLIESHITPARKEQKFVYFHFQKKAS